MGGFVVEGSGLRAGGLGLRVQGLSPLALVLLLLLALALYVRGTGIMGL